MLTRRNVVEQNYWDRYSGFDKNGDNIGDRPTGSTSMQTSYGTTTVK
ncbi:MAG: hypothetical protein ABFR02_10285 [Campylobacterota bacterium]